MARSVPINSLASLRQSKVVVSELSVVGLGRVNLNGFKLVLTNFAGVWGFDLLLDLRK